jgi:hypothetical protein
MPQPKSSDDARLRQLRELLGQAVVIPTERLQSVLDDARRRGHVDTKGVEEIVQGVLKQSEEARGRLESLLAAAWEPWLRALGRTPTKDGTTPTQTAQAKERAKASGTAATTSTQKRAAPSTSRGFPIKGYDSLKAAEITAKLDGLTAAQLKKVRKKESDGKGRKGILSAIDRKLK